MVVAVDHHHGRAEAGQLPQQVLVGRTVHGREHDAVNLSAAQHLELGALLGRILARAAQQQPVAADARHRLDARDDLDEERMHQIGDDDANGVAAAEGQTARDGVSLIAELFDLREDAIARGLADIAVVVQDFGNRHDGYAELAGDSPHRGSGHGLWSGLGALSIKSVDFTGKPHQLRAATCNDPSAKFATCLISAIVTSTRTTADTDPRMLRPCAFKSPASACNESSVPAATVTCW